MYQTQIFSTGQITGAFSVQETNDLALVLRSGALPAPMIILEEQYPSHSLLCMSHPSIRDGVLRSGMLLYLHLKRI